MRFFILKVAFFLIMNILQIISIAFLAIIHVYILILEMFLWTKPKGHKAFGLKDKKFAEETKVLAANQGLYNGFLATGCIWSIIAQRFDIGLFFATCILIAGLYGYYSTKKVKILIIQSVPATISILLLLL